MDSSLSFVIGAGALFVALVTLVVLKHPWRTNWDEVEDLTESELALEERANFVLDEIYEEWESARKKFGPFNSDHEGFAVLHEEFDELKAEVWANPKKRKNRDAKMRAEAIQVGAMALRFLTDCCDKE